MNLKNNIALKIIIIVFLVVGAGLLLGALATTGVSLYRQQSSIETHATVIDVDDSGRATLQYALESGEVFTNKLSFSSSEFYEGKELTVYYDPGDPARVVTGVWVIVALVLGGIGLFFLMFFAIFALVGGQKRGRARRLKKNGVLAYADIDSVYVDGSLSVNGRHPWRIRLLYYDAERGEERVLKTTRLWVDPQPAIDQKRLEALPVYLGARNPRRYYVDVDELER